jgi:hypothetical protein
LLLLEGRREHKRKGGRTEHKRKEGRKEGNWPINGVKLDDVFAHYVYIRRPLHCGKRRK